MHSYVTQSVANHTGSCSLLASQGDIFDSNTAGFAGAVIYSADVGTTKISSTYFHLDDVTNVTMFGWNSSREPCSAWHDNTVGPHGYGLLSFPPANLSVSMPDLTDYVSDGISSLALTIKVLDQAGTQVTSGVWSKHVLHRALSFHFALSLPLASLSRNAICSALKSIG